jgi:hypothetical protein
MAHQISMDLRTYPVLSETELPPRRVRRRISPQAGRALVILGHAIEYLSDEFVHEGGPVSLSDGRIEAIQLLMSVNRQIYFECPVILPLGTRILGFLCRQES